jgi:hypothetical protein
MVLVRLHGQRQVQQVFKNLHLLVHGPNQQERLLFMSSVLVLVVVEVAEEGLRVVPIGAPVLEVAVAQGYGESLKLTICLVRFL